MARNTNFGENHQGLQVENNQGSITFNQSQSCEEIDRLCLRNLRCPDPRLAKNRLKESKDKLLAESFEWILQDQKYQSWRDGDEVCLLWIKGGAGKGKTMISIGLIEELLRFCSDKSSAITYFFCQNSDNEFNTLEGMMKGLILQLLRQQPALMECLRSRWDAAKSSFDQDLTSWRTLWHILLEMIDQCDCAKLYLVLDALDECQDGDMDEFLKALVRNGLHSTMRIKWLLTSRPLDSAERALLAGHEQIQLSLELESDRLSSAVKAYVTHKVNELGRQHGYERALKKTLEFQLLERSGGTFLWVSLVCKRLEGICPEEALAAIQNTPHGLEPLYRQVFKQLSCGRTREVQMCMRLLKAMMVAYRPLKMGEFAAISGLEDDDDVSLMSLIIRCASFLKLRGESLEFVHQSARDYLAGKDTQLAFNSHGTFGHYEFVLNCLSCLSQSLKVNLLDLQPDSNIDTVRALRENNESTALDTVEYAATFWGQHFRDSYHVNPRSDAICRDTIIDFLHTKLLEWLECLSLLDILPVAMTTLQHLENIFKDEPPSLAFVSDSIRFVSSHYATLEKWPIQVYASALIWSPESSVVRKRNLDRLPWLRSVAGLEATWGSRVRTFKINCWIQWAVSSDGKQLATSSMSIANYSRGTPTTQHICIWNIATGILQQDFSLKSNNVISQMCFSEDNKKIFWFSCCRRNYLHSWEITSGDVQSIPVEHPGFGKTVVLSPMSMQVASIVSGHGILIWDIATGKLRTHVLLRHSIYDQRLFFSLDGNRVVCDVSDREFRIWDTATGRLQKKLVKPPGFLHCSAHSPDGSQMAYHFEKGDTREYDILIWNTISGRTSLIEAVNRGARNEECLAFSPDGKKIAYGSKCHDFIYVWDLSTNRPHVIFSEKALSVVQALAFCSSDKIISFTAECQIDLWNMETLLEKRRESSLTDPKEVSFSHDGKSIVCCHWDNFMVVDTGTGVTQKTIPVPFNKGGIQTARFLPGDEKIVVGLLDGVFIWEAATSTFQWQRDGFVYGIAASPNGKYLAGIFDADTIQIWKIRTGALKMTLKSNQGNFSCLAFSPDSKKIASYTSITWGTGVYRNPFDLRIWDVSRSLRASKFLGDTISSHIPCHKPKKMKFQLQTPRKVLKFSSEGQHVLSSNGAFIVNDIHEKSEEKEATDDLLPYLYLSIYGWICYGRQAFIKLPQSTKSSCQDLGDERIVVGFENRGLLALDIDTTILSEKLGSAISTYRSTSTIASSYYMYNDEDWRFES